MDNLERRFTTGEIRATATGRWIQGYAIVFNALSEDLGGFRERIHPDAVKRSLGEELRAYYNHNTDNIIGYTGARPPTLRASVDSRGLAVDIDVPRTSFGSDMLESIGRGDVQGMSFGFRTLADDWDHRRGAEPIRTILDMRVFEVSVVSHPAYPDTSVALRALGILRGRSLATLVLEHRQRTAGWR